MFERTYTLVEEDRAGLTVRLREVTIVLRLGLHVRDCEG